MALSDVIYEAALEIEDGVFEYQDGVFDYPNGEVLKLVEFLKRYAGIIQDGDVDIPKLPVIEKSTFVGTQRGAGNGD